MPDEREDQADLEEWAERNERWFTDDLREWWAARYDGRDDA